jgi:hypothetical protein
MREPAVEAFPVVMSSLPAWLWSSPLGIGLVGAVTCVLVLGLVQVMSRRGRKTSAAMPANVLLSEPGPPARSEKRVALRREGGPVDVIVSAATLPGTLHGVVLDRSLGGLSLAVGQEIAPGTILTVRPSRAGSLVPSVELAVRHCRQEGPDWILGCQFTKTPPYSVLLHFG